MGRETERGAMERKNRHYHQNFRVCCRGPVGRWCVNMPCRGSLCSSGSKGRSLSSVDGQTQDVWALGQEVQNSGQGHGGDCRNRLHQ